VSPPFVYVLPGRVARLYWLEDLKGVLVPAAGAFKIFGHLLAKMENLWSLFIRVYSVNLYLGGPTSIKKLPGKGGYLWSLSHLIKFDQSVT
jgi:hypothetical protein